MNENDAAMQNMGMYKRQKVVKGGIAAQVKMQEDLILLRKKKDGGVSLKDALFKAAGNNTESEMTNMSTKTNKITEMLKNKGINDTVDDPESLKKKGIDTDEVYLQENDPLYEEAKQTKTELLGEKRDRRPSDAMN